MTAILLVVPGATEDELAAVETALGRPLAAEHRLLLAIENGSEGWHGDLFLIIYGTSSIIAVNAEIERHPGFVVLGSDGSRELIGFDMRADLPPVVMIDITSEGWDAALFQAPTLADFMRQRANGEDLKWDQPYRPQGASNG